MMVFAVGSLSRPARAAGPADGISAYAFFVYHAKADLRVSESLLTGLKADFPTIPIVANEGGRNAPESLKLIQANTRPGDQPRKPYLRSFGVGLTPADEEHLPASKSRWAGIYLGPSDKATLAVKQLDQIVARLADAHADGAYIYDNSTIRYYSPTWWKQERLTAWEGDVPDLHAFLGLDIGDVTGTKAVWLGTKGMEKFGQPDVIINDIRVDPDRSYALLLLAAQNLIEGRPPVAAAERGKPAMLTLDLDAVRHPRFRAAMEKLVTPGAQRKFVMPTREGKVDKAHPEIAPLELDFSGLPGASVAERQDAVLRAVDGEPPVTQK